MVKRNTDYKQLYLVDSFYLKHFNQQNQSLQNKISNNHNILLTTPKTQQYFNNHYSIPQSNLDKYNYNSFANTVQTNFNNESQNNDISKETNHKSDDYSRNKVERKVTQDDVGLMNPPDSFQYYDDDSQNVARQPEYTERSGDDVSYRESVPYYDNFQNRKLLSNDSDRNKNISLSNSNLVSKDLLNKTKRQFYSCYICKKTFSNIALLEKHNMMKHKRYDNLNVENGNNDILIDDPSIVENDRINSNQQIDDNDNDIINQSTENLRSNSQNNLIDIQDTQTRQNRNSSPITNSGGGDDDDDDDWIDIPDSQSNVNNSNSQIAIRRDIQTNFPNSNNIAKRKKQNDNIEKFYTYKCGECFMGFKNYDALKQHQLQSHGKVGGMKRSITSNMQGIINEGQKVEELNSYWCSTCGKFLQNFASMKAHLEKEHQNAPLRAKRSKTNDKIKRKRVLYYTKY